MNTNIRKMKLCFKMFESQSSSGRRNVRRRFGATRDPKRRHPEEMDEMASTGSPVFAEKAEAAERCKVWADWMVPQKARWPSSQKQSHRMFNAVAPDHRVQRSYKHNYKSLRPASIFGWTTVQMSFIWGYTFFCLKSGKKQSILCLFTSNLWDERGFNFFFTWFLDLLWVFFKESSTETRGIRAERR